MWSSNEVKGEASAIEGGRNHNIRSIGRIAITHDISLLKGVAPGSLV